MRLRRIQSQRPLQPMRTKSKANGEEEGPALEESGESKRRAPPHRHFWRFAHHAMANYRKAEGKGSVGRLRKQPTHSNYFSEVSSNPLDATFAGSLDATSGTHGAAFFARKGMLIADAGQASTQAQHFVHSSQLVPSSG